jgi:hypothetical protein
VEETLDPAYAEELLRRQDALQAEARAVTATLDLAARLGQVGTVQAIGSAASGLMVWRDLDFNILCPGAPRSSVLAALQPLFLDPQVLSWHFADEQGTRSPTARPEDDRYYCVLHYAPDATREWKIDCSFWLNPAPRSQVAHVAHLVRTLTPKTRRAILWIKDVWHRLPTYPYTVGGTDVYTAVLDHGVRTPAQFDAYLRAHGLPGREA